MTMKFKNIKFALLFLVITSFLISCYISKPLAVEVRVSVNTNFPVVIKNESNSNFVNKHTEADYRTAYVNELMKELAFNHIVVDNASPEFLVEIASLYLTESTKLDTVKDVKSKDNGIVRELTLAGLKTHGTVMKTSDRSIHKWEADKDKNESLTNNRSLEQIIEGKNKDNTVYREKAFSDDEFITQSGVCGRRAAVRIAHEIGKMLKK